MKTTFFLALAALSIFSACKKQEVKDDERILDYIEEKGLTATKTDEGVYYVISTVGTGVHPTVEDNINMNYTGKLLDGTIFDQGVNVEFPLGGLIEGFQIGMPYLREGGAGILLIPSHLGYGSNAVGTIPKNSVLVFEVVLNDVL